jgi:1A family penicillin-binding protein
MHRRVIQLRQSIRTLEQKTSAILGRVYTARPRALVATIAVLAVLVFATAGWLAYFAYDLTSGLPNRQALRELGDMVQSTTIFDAKDRPAFTIFKEQRIEVPLDRMSPNLINAVVAIEDQRFYEHGGIDAVRVGGAVLRNLRAGRRAEGGSTITQQLARQSFLTRGKTYRRKLKEVILAAYIENLYSKKEILEMYLNKVYFGDGLHGVEAAARGYFGKSAADLQVDEAALIAGLIQSPSSYAPTVNPDRAVARRNTVLQAMVSYGAIDAATADKAKAAPIKLNNSLEIRETFGLYFKEAVRRELVDRFGWQRVYQGGLRVYTTIDSDLQQAAEALVEEGLQDIEKRSGFKHAKRGAPLPVSGKPGLKAEADAPDYLQGALVAMDPANGHVSVLVGGRDFNESRFNRAIQAKRQSGSAFKPFVYAAALEAGYSPASLISGLNSPILTVQGEWIPEDDHSTADELTMRAALRTSSNRAAVQMLSTVGIPKAVDYAEKLNVGRPPSVPSLALGASDVTLASLTAAYGAFADGGIVRTPVLIRRVEDSDGKVLFAEEDKSHRAVSEATAFLMASMLQDVINAGTAYRARQIGFMLPAAGKTGTTNDYNDAWFVGFTPHMVTGVWVGFDRPKTIASGGYAGELAVPIWAQFMKRATRGDKADWFARPANVVGLNVCRLSGKLPAGGCDNVQVINRDGLTETRSMIYTEYFVRGTEPKDECPLHSGLSFGERLAGIFGKDVGTPVSVDDVGLPPPAASTSGAQTSPSVSPSSSTVTAEKAEEPKKKRGFWGRIFGGGDDDKRGEEEKKKEEERRKAEERRRKGG